MSRIGKKMIHIPESVSFSLKNGTARISGPKGELEVKIIKGIDVKLNDHQITVTRSSDERKYRSMHGTIRQLIANAVKGVSDGFMKELEIRGVGNYVSDIGHTIQSYVESFGYSVVRELVGHGIGTQLHEDPQIPNYGVPKQGYKLQEGMCIAIEPMINLGVKEIITDKDGWTIRTADGKSSAHFEHTIAITSGKAVILSEKSEKDELTFVK